jgi:hypothetical protein
VSSETSQVRRKEVFGPGFHLPPMGIERVRRHAVDHTRFGD